MIRFENPDDYPEVSAELRRAVVASPYPWHRILPNVATVRLVPNASMQPEGRAWPSGLTEVKAEKPPTSAAWVLLHELGHHVDRWTLTDDDRAELMTAAGAPFDPALVGRAWRAPGAAYFHQPREVYAQLFARVFRPPSWPAPGPMAPAWLPMPEALIEPVTLRRPIMPWSDVAALPADTVAAILELADLGVTIGTGPDTWEPAAPVTRAQLALFLTRLLEVVR